MCAYLYSACLVCRVLKIHIPRNKLWWLLPNIAYVMRKTILRNLDYVQCLNIALMKKPWCMKMYEKENVSLEFSLGPGLV